MCQPEHVRIAVIGTGIMGSKHAQMILEDKVPGAQLTAVCDTNERARAPFNTIKQFDNAEALFAAHTADAVIIATPHYSHPTLSLAAFAAGLHVLVEKPLAVTTAECRQVIDAHCQSAYCDLRFALMFNQRTNPLYIKLKQMIDAGELGDIQRVSWVITDWFRTEAYYRHGGWRATWAGEGGGVLLNQCPHQLDLFQWLFGMPIRLRSFCQFGSDHSIEVEDRVTTYLEYDNGMTGTFIASTGESPGTNRLEIACDRGRVVLDSTVETEYPLQFQRTGVSVRDFCRTSEEAFAHAPVENVSIDMRHGGEKHLGIMKNFVNTIRGQEQLIARGEEGIHSVELANAMLYSAFNDCTVELPIDAQAYTAALQAKIDASNDPMAMSLRQ